LPEIVVAGLVLFRVVPAEPISDLSLAQNGVGGRVKPGHGGRRILALIAIPVDMD
jgi:hypothetical protein